MCINVHMNQHTTRRLVVDLPAADHMALKSVAASSGVPMRTLILSALRSELQARRAALSRPAPRANP